MPLTFNQLGALLKVREILHDAGILQSKGSLSDNSDSLQLHNVLNSHLPMVSHPLLEQCQYSPPMATPFTEEEIQNGQNRTTQQGYAHALVEHPAGAVIEYPQTGSLAGEAIAHRFAVNLNQTFVNPKDNVQYSLGDSHGGHTNFTCHLLHDTGTQEAVPCYQLKISCKRADTY
ncbi:hypothetical protein K439DRAFT_1614149 [Ramaria rubella]|nr:hypothetical protein K439DRAFT_1614149 [Ramaria rubella]